LTFIYRKRSVPSDRAPSAFSNSSRAFRNKKTRSGNLNSAHSTIAQSIIIATVFMRRVPSGVKGAAASNIAAFQAA
jgi:hypothetical protein